MECFSLGIGGAYLCIVSIEEAAWMSVYKTWVQLTWTTLECIYTWIGVTEVQSQCEQDHIWMWSGRSHCILLTKWAMGILRAWYRLHLLLLDIQWPRTSIDIMLRVQLSSLTRMPCTLNTKHEGHIAGSKNCRILLWKYQNALVFNFLHCWRDFHGGQWEAYISSRNEIHMFC